MIKLLIVIYLAFIGLGLPDSLLGAAWPVMHADIGAPMSAAGVVSIIACSGTVISSLFSNRLIHRFKTGKVTLVSVLTTAIALLGMSFSNSMILICLLSIPLGLGAGSVDAALNNFVSIHYDARHMSWLHCLWGLGATVGPIIMALFLAKQGGWHTGYLTISLIQFLIAFVLLLSLPMWRKVEHETLPSDGNGESAVPEALISNREVIKRPGVKYALAAFLCYCGHELAAGLWAASYLTSQKAFTPELAANSASLYFAGITFGRVVAGFVSSKISAQNLIRIGCCITFAGAITLLLPLPALFSVVGFILIGLGSAPFYPMMIHETPARFGKKYSRAAMGLQMATAYIGSTFLPPLIGLLSKYLTLSVLPWILLALAIGAFAFSEKVHRVTKIA